MDPLKTVLVVGVSFLLGLLAGGWMLFVFEERLDRQAGDIYLEDDDDGNHGDADAGCTREL